MRRLSFLLTLPILIVAAVFSVVNRQAVPVDLWPLQQSVDVPLFALLLAGLVVGLLFGGLAGWLSAGKARRRAREERARVRALEARVADLSRRVAVEAEEMPAQGHGGHDNAHPPFLRLAGGRR